MTTTDEARVTDEEIASEVRQSRAWLRRFGDREMVATGIHRVIVALSYRLASKDNLIRELHELGRQDGELIVALERQRAEFVELMSKARSMVASVAAIGIKRGVTEWLAKVDAARRTP